VEDEFMSRTDLLCLNRVTKPQIPLEEFLAEGAAPKKYRLLVRLMPF
jgi:hypothetical protein